MYSCSHAAVSRRQVQVGLQGLTYGLLQGKMTTNVVRLFIEQVGSGRYGQAGVDIQGAGRGHVDGQLMPTGKGHLQVPGCISEQDILYTDCCPACQFILHVCRNITSQQAIFDQLSAPDGITRQMTVDKSPDQQLLFIRGQMVEGTDHDGFGSGRDGGKRLTGRGVDRNSSYLHGVFIGQSSNILRNFRNRPEITLSK